jgi:hypothetical protein
MKIIWLGFHRPVFFLTEDTHGTMLVMENHEFYHPQKI